MDEITKAIAIQLLRGNGYVVVEKTASMEADVAECEEMSCSGTDDKDCLGCACNVCVMQG